MQIPCPWCGPRNQVEFTYGGDATLTRPAHDAPEAVWAEYVYFRDNPCGPHEELWFHGAGCRGWFKVRRNTRTHDILGSAPIDRAFPREAERQEAGAHPRERDDAGGSGQVAR